MNENIKEYLTSEYQGRTVEVSFSAQVDTDKYDYEYLLEKASETFTDVQAGVFGAMMKVSLVNDGPFTIFLDSEEVLAKHPD